MNKAKKPPGRPKKRSMTGTAVNENPGRPSKVNLEEVSYSTKNRRAHDIANMYDLQTIQLALDIAKRKSNYIEGNTSNYTITCHSTESAFAFFLENDFSKEQWERLVEDCKRLGVPIYPSVYKLNEIKQKCRPSMYSVENEVCVQVSFQIMINKTAERLLSSIQN